MTSSGNRSMEISWSYWPLFLKLESRLFYSQK